MSPAFPSTLIEISMMPAGLAAGSAYFATLHRTVRLFAEQRRWLAPAALTIARIVAVVLFLGAVAKLGAGALLSASLGFWLGRYLVVRAARRAS